MLLYDRGRFLQTLEGPLDGLGQVWSSIQRDERHSGITVLAQHLVGGRLFSGWDLLCYRRLEQPERNLRQRFVRRRDLSRYVPQAVAFALEADEARLNTLMAELADEGWSKEDLARGLIEPAARGLGDAWLADEVGEFEVTLGLGLLQVASHTISRVPYIDRMGHSRYTISLAPAPGEPHMLGTSLLADQLSPKGWRVDLTFPRSDLELIRALRECEPDALDLSISDAMLRPGSLSRLRETIERARAAMTQKPFVVSVGGRLFEEAVAAAEHVSADHARRSSVGTGSVLSQLLHNRRKIASST